MLQPRARKNGTDCWAARTRRDPSDPAGLERRRFHSFDYGTLSLVRFSSAHGLLQAVKANPKVLGRFAVPIKQMIQAELSFGYRTVADLVHFSDNTVQRVFQLMGWHVRKRAIGDRPRIEALPSGATTPNERWATDLCRASGQVVTVDRSWRRSSSTVIRESGLAGRSREAAERRRPRRRWSRR